MSETTETTTAADDTGSPQSPASGSPQSSLSGSPQSSLNGSPLKVHHLRPAPGAKKAKTRVGRGEASKGKTAGRGTKGTKARYQVPAAFEGGQMPLHMRLPKLKGFTNRFRTSYQVVNLDRLSALFPDGGTVGVEELVAAGAVRDGELVKVLGDGELTAPLQLTAHKFSASAREKVQAAGGSVSEL